MIRALYIAAALAMFLAPLAILAKASLRVFLYFLGAVLFLCGVSFLDKDTENSGPSA